MVVVVNLCFVVFCDFAGHRFWIIIIWYVWCRKLRAENMARACQQQLITYSANDRWQTDIRIWAAVITTKTDAAVSKGANFSIAAVPFSKGTSTTSFSLKVIHEFACWLCGTWGHVSQSPLFSVAAVCCFFAIFLGTRSTYRPPKFPLTSNKAPRLQGKHLQLTH